MTPAPHACLGRIRPFPSARSFVQKQPAPRPCPCRVRPPASRCSPPSSPAPFVGWFEADSAHNASAPPVPQNCLAATLRILHQHTALGLRSPSPACHRAREVVRVTRRALHG